MSNEFFEQLCRAVSRAGGKHTCFARSEAWQNFLQTAVQEGVPPAAQEGGPRGSLAELQRAVMQCRKCVLHQSRNHAVFGEGAPDARLMFIGEGPGYEEDRSGRPFVGPAGQLLDKMISAMQFARQEVYICNVVKCRPPNNRNPMPEEASCCIGYLKEQIRLIHPDVIVLLGATAAHYLLDTPSRISELRGRWFRYGDIPVMPTFHPAYLLRHEESKREAWSDLQQVMAKFGKYHNPQAKRQ